MGLLGAVVDPESLALSPTRLGEASDEVPTTAPDPSGDPQFELEPLQAHHEPQPGERIGEHYRVIRQLGSGAMGVVLLAQDELLDRLVAIKLIRSNLLSQSFRQRFLAEARVMAKISHPNVLGVYTFGEHLGM